MKRGNGGNSGNRPSLLFEFTFLYLAGGRFPPALKGGNLWERRAGPSWGVLPYTVVRGAGVLNTAKSCTGGTNPGVNRTGCGPARRLRSRGPAGGRIFQLRGRTTRA